MYHQINNKISNLIKNMIKIYKNNKLSFSKWIDLKMN